MNVLRLPPRLVPVALVLVLLLVAATAAVAAWPVADAAPAGTPPALEIGAASTVGSAPQDPAPAVRFEQHPDTSSMRWFKGNTHAHTTESDGDSPPEYVARWYRDHGYNFLVMSDHNVFNDPRKLAHLETDEFILIPGEEVSSGFDGRPVHVNGLNIPGLVEPRTGDTMVETIQANVDAVRDVEGVPHVNHPNFVWAFGAAELAQVRNDRLLEIHNAHPTVHNEGGGGSPGLEEIWDTLLTGGKRIYGIAVDDAHTFQGEFSADLANPGRAWVMVQATALDAAEIMVNLERGLFYATTGPLLDGITVEPRRLRLAIRQESNFRYTTTFIGDGGEVLATSGSLTPEYELDGRRHSYVRARIVDSGGRRAWVQPVFVAGETGGAQ